MTNGDKPPLPPGKMPKELQDQAPPPATAPAPPLPEGKKGKGKDKGKGKKDKPKKGGGGPSFWEKLFGSKKEASGLDEEIKEAAEIKKKFQRPKVDYSSDQFEEIESYPVQEPFAYVRILYNRESHTKVYHVVEPELTRKEQKAIDSIKEALTRSLEVHVDTLELDPKLYLSKMTEKIIHQYNLPVPKQAFDKLFYFIERDLLGYGPIDILMKDPNIEDISCVGPFIPVYIYDRRYESLETTIIWEDEPELDSYIVRLAQRCDKHISIAEPLLDATLMDGSRVVMKLGREVSTHGSSFTIRKFKEEPFTPPDLIDFNTISPLIGAYMWLAFQHGMSMLVCGGTASGKTTTLNALCLFIGKEMKIVSIEETRELNLPHPNWIPGCTRQGFGGEGTAGAVTMYDLLRAALRERPEYIIVGEIRGAEAYVLFQAMATGHTTYSTIHADSVPSLVHRLENKPIDIPRVMIPSLDIATIQIQTRVGEKRVRRQKQVIEIIGLDPHTGELLTNEVFRWIPATDEFEFSGKSYVLEKIMVRTNMNKSQIMQELKNRKEILEWMVERDIRKHDEVAAIVAEYYVNPEAVMARVHGEVPEEYPAMMEEGGIPPGKLPPGYPSREGEMEGFECPSCGAIVDANAPFCPECGEQFEEGFECPSCGEIIDGNATVCPACGEVFGVAPGGAPAAAPSAGGTVSCPACGESVAADAIMCPACGEPLGGA